jgi:hypothetical protein
MSNSLSLQNFEDITTSALAPVIPMRSVPSENDKQIRKVSKVKGEKEVPLFYTKPIFKTKKYDLL